MAAGTVGGDGQATATVSSDVDSLGKTFDASSTRYQAWSEPSPNYRTKPSHGCIYSNLKRVSIMHSGIVIMYQLGSWDWYSVNEIVLWFAAEKSLNPKKNRITE